MESMITRAQIGWRQLNSTTRRVTLVYTCRSLPLLLACLVLHGDTYASFFAVIGAIALLNATECLWGKLRLVQWSAAGLIWCELVLLLLLPLLPVFVVLIVWIRYESPDTFMGPMVMLSWIGDIYRDHIQASPALILVYLVLSFSSLAIIAFIGRQSIELGAVEVSDAEGVVNSHT